MRGRFGVVPVTGHHLRAADDQFPDLTGRQRPDSGLRVHDHGIGVGQRQADVPGARGAVERSDVRDRAGFGEAVAFDDDRPGAVRELGRDVRVQRRTAGDARPDRTQTRSVSAGVPC